MKEIAALYGRSAQVLDGPNATVGRFLAAAKASTVVHFAGHALVNPRTPFQSLLLLAPSPGDSGALTAERLLLELAQAQAQARLFVLGACGSAGGHSIGPSGLSALVRPLVAAGVPAVVGSLWNVGDDVTKSLLVRFHRHYVAGADAARALPAGPARSPA